MFPDSKYITQCLSCTGLRLIQTQIMFLGDVCLLKFDFCVSAMMVVVMMMLIMIIMIVMQTIDGTTVYLCLFQRFVETNTQPAAYPRLPLGDYENS